MRLTVFNGSPRGRASNTACLLEPFLEGFSETAGNAYELHYLAREKELEEHIRAFSEAECALWAFPLYTDCMPWAVKNFIEALAPFCGRQSNPSLGFLIHSGFPESLHSHNLKRYLEKLASRLGCPLIGTVIKGGSEGIREQPPAMTRALFRRMRELGQVFGRSGGFDPVLTARLAQPVRFSVWKLPVARIGLKMAELMYWNRMLKGNGAYEKRFARPYSQDNAEE